MVLNGMASEPQRLAYRIVYVSSQDEDLGETVDDANAALRAGRGWVSSKYCHFPQEIVLKLHQYSNIDKIQLFCHHLFIPSKVDVYIGHDSTRAESPSWSHATFEKLGSVTFQDNGGIDGYKTRELKTIRVDSAGSFVKFLVYENFKSDSNPYSQVALLNIMITGFPNGRRHSDASDSDLSEPVGSRHTNSPMGAPAPPPPMTYPIHKRTTPSFLNRSRNPTHAYVDSNPDELKVIYGMSYSQEMRTVSHILDVRKKAAVRDEQFETAKQLKAAIDKLHVAGERIDKLNSEKRSAIEDEDYDRAEHYKKEMDTIRDRTYQEIELSKYLSDKEKHDLGLDNLEMLPERPPSRLKRSESAPAHKRSSPRSTNPYVDRDNMVLPAIRNQQLRQQQTRTRQHSDEFDSRLPRIDHGNTPPGVGRLDEYPSEEPAGYEPYEEPVSDENTIYRLHPKDVAQLQQAISTFGAKMVKHCTSKQWQERQKGLQDLYAYLDQHRFHDREDAFNVLSPAMQLLQRALKDKIYNVYKEATNVLRYILLSFLPKFKIAKAGGQLVAERTYYTLITRTGDTVSDPRYRPTSMEFCENAVSKTDAQIAKIYAACFLRPFQASGHQKIDQAHAEIAERVITTNEAPNADLDLTEEKICPFAVSCLQHTDASVRQSGTRILSYIYKMGNREKVQRYLPKNNDVTRKKWPLYKTIFDEFDRIDGKMGPALAAPLVTGVGGGRIPGVTREESEIDKLKRENEELKRQLTSHSGMHSSSPTMPYSGPISARSGQEANHLCVFCGEVNRSFDEETLDMHYLKYCPVLTKCQLCQKVVEISALREHYFFECTAKNLFRQCPRCKEPLLEEEFKRHQAQKRCQPPKHGASVERCLLCHKDVSPNDDEAWKRHLVGPTGCPANPRKTFGIGAGKGPTGRRRNSTGAIDARRCTNFHSLGIV